MEKYDKKLKQLCKVCYKENGYCVKNEPFIGLCAETDKDELIEIWQKREESKKENRK